MRLSEIETAQTGWTTVRPKVTRALSAISKKIGAEFAPNKSGFNITNDLGNASDWGLKNGGWLNVNLYARFSQNGAYGKHRIHAGIYLLVGGESVRMTSDGGIDNERQVPVWQKELEPDASAEEILAMLEEFKSHIPAGLEAMNAEIAKLKGAKNESLAEDDATAWETLEGRIHQRLAKLNKQIGGNPEWQDLYKTGDRASGGDVILRGTWVQDERSNLIDIALVLSVMDANEASHEINVFVSELPVSANKTQILDVLKQFEASVPKALERFELELKK